MRGAGVLADVAAGVPQAPARPTPPTLRPAHGFAFHGGAGVFLPVVQRKTPPPSLPLFGERPTSARAWELVDRAPIGSTLVPQYKKGAGGRKLGPYYVARFYVDGKPRTVYLGSEANVREWQAACVVVGEELEAANRAPAARRAAALEERARGGKVKRAKDSRRVASIPILRFGGTAK